jgi:hypothetical protein
MDPSTVDRLTRLADTVRSRRAALATLLGTAALGMGLGSRSVKAGKPEVIEEHVESGPDPIAQCDTFTVLIQSDYILTERFFVDAEGNLTQIEGSAHGTDTFINSETGKAIEAPFHNNSLGDPQKPQRAFTGIILKVIVPGVGAVLLEIGRLVLQRGEVVFQKGPQQLTEGDLDALCEALAGEP